MESEISAQKIVPRRMSLPVRVFSLWQQQPVFFSVVWLFFFLALFTLFSFAGLVPQLLSGESMSETIKNDTTNASTQTVLARTQEQGYTNVVGVDDPVRIVIGRIGVDASVRNPEEKSVPALDAALLDGAVRYPGSAGLAHNGTVLIFAHSAGFAIVHNQNYRVFDRLHELVSGDVVQLQTNDREYVYVVSGVKKVDAREALVNLSRSGRHLTLSTCDTFGAKQDRYVVEADFIGSRNIQSSGAASPQ